MSSDLLWGSNPGDVDQSKVDNRASTVAELILHRFESTPDAEAFRYPVGDGWESVTWGQTGERVRRLAAGLISLGIEPEQRVAIASSTRYEWVLADFAIMCAGAATTTIYPTTTPDEVSYILGDSGSRLVFVEDDEQLKKIREHRAELPDIAWLVTFADGAGSAEGAGDGDSDNLLTLAELEERGAAHLAEHPDAVEKAVSTIGPDSLATLIYTSGTTGRPKGVRLTHDCWTYEGAAIDAVRILHPDDLQYLWLPLAHSFGKVLLSAQVQIGFSSAIDGRVDKIIENVAVVRPTFMGAAPRIFEKAYGKINSTIEHEGGPKAALFHWAVGVGRRVSELRQQGTEPSGVLALQYKVADRLVFAKIRDRFGGRLRFFVSGSAALSQHLSEWFHAAGILIIEGYGLTETSAGSCVNLPGRFRFGSVGPALPGTQVRIAHDGEVLIKGPGVMRGYQGMPELSDEVLDPDGWFHTGDIGQLDDQGMLRITDRKKDLFKTSNGKYVAPQAIETMFKALCPYASQVVVHGEGRTFCSALVTLDEDSIVGWARENGLEGRSYEEIARSDQARAMVQGYVDRLNAQLNRWETIKKFAILDHDLTVDDGEMTPSLKLKRRVVETRYADVLEAFYS
ncbi:long-chain fatty acid--CoA ligase [Actinopolymorpha sp. NPDC004070]|uniref:AMP-dependent synthetase/ligase n=1 Tax=Actinopolymorpha sp. NPDC004070 TaxID=3154548 RepID=UPI0033A4BE22